MNRNPHIVAIVPLLFLVLYVASFYLLVKPKALSDDIRFYRYPVAGYFDDDRLSDRINCCLQTVYWPLEQIDMMVRPDSAW